MQTWVVTFDYMVSAYITMPLQIKSSISIERFEKRRINVGIKIKADSHYCVFRVRLQQTVAFLQGDRKFPISALTQPTAENADRCVYSNLF